jgi:transposase InsO family protein
MEDLFYIDVEFKEHEGEEWTKTRAMIDSGSQGSVINKDLSERYIKNHQRFPIPIHMIMADGQRSTAPLITHFDDLCVRIADGTERIKLDIATLGKDVILGAPWLKVHNPTMNFQARFLTFDSEYCEKHCEHFQKTIKMHRRPNEPRQEPAERTNEPCREPAEQTNEPRQEQAERTERTRQRKEPRRTAPQVSLISATAFARTCNQPETELYLMSMTTYPNETAYKEGPNLENIPTEYHDLAKLFSKNEADKMPPHKAYDHKINLAPGTEPPFGPIYKLSPIELDTLRDYVEENLKKGFIRHSQSQCAAPIVFVKKKDGSLRICVDYRGLNKITVKNRYPLPLIGEMLDRIGRAKYFTKFDVRDGYNRLRMAEGEEWKTAFRCRYGLFEYTVMPFGLCNAPGTFQHFMNDTFRDLLDRFLVIYLDDFLIYSDSLETHRQHVRQVMERMGKVELYLKPSKCQFHVQEVEFLGFIVGKEGVKMDPTKVQSITSWPTPKSAHDIRTFLGLANFYRRFIENFSKTVTPLTNLLKKEQRFNWTRDADQAFELLKKRFTTAPILQHFNVEIPAILETDASDFALGAVVSQKAPDGKLHPVGFHSRKFNPAELNYEIYDKEMLAIVEALEHYRHYFEGLGHQTTIYSDHLNLLWFTETKVYNRCQARWAEKLSKYDFKIVFRPGKEGGKPDALSRRPDYAEGAKAAEGKPMTILKPEQIDTSALSEQTLREYGLLQKREQATRLVDTEMQEELATALRTDERTSEYIQHLEDPTLPRTQMAQRALARLSLEEGLLIQEGKIYIPNSTPIKLKILQTHHDSQTAGHQGRERTLELIARKYTWPGMRRFVKEYVRTCETCARNKPTNHRRYGQLHPLPIPEAPWNSVSMDYIVELPNSQGYNAIYVCVDRLTKMAHFIPTTAEGTAKLYLREVFKHHGLPKDIVSDRGPQFTAKFTKALLEACAIKGNRSTAYHPQSDGQTERVNQTLEQYLRTYCNYHQDDWYELLPMAEFAYNNSQNTSTQTSPFFANYGYHPRTNPSLERTNNPAANRWTNDLQEVHEELKNHLKQAREAYKRGYDRKAQAAPTFLPGELVWLSRANIKTQRPSQKLEARRMGPFKVLDIVGESRLARRLELPSTMRKHPVFHVGQLEPYYANSIAGRTQLAPAPEIVDEEPEWEVAEDLDSKIERGKLRYLIDWKGYSVDERTWEPAENVQHAERLVQQFHSQHPHHAGPRDLPRRSLAR